MLTIFSLILADNIIIYLSFIIINGNLLKYIAVTAQLLQQKFCIISLSYIRHAFGKNPNFLHFFKFTCNYGTYNPFCLYNLMLFLIHIPIYICFTEIYYGILYGLHYIIIQMHQTNM